MSQSVGKHTVWPHEKLYFPSLTGLRAIAAFCVLFTHVERYRITVGRSAVIDMPLNSFIGSQAVTFFFVLSGFLITSFLLREKDRTGTIQVMSFFRRRALRIWPLYYVVLAAGYLISIFVIRDTDSNILRNGFLLNALLLPNVAFVLDKIPEIIVQLWSLGTEEQFYFVWPFLIRRTTQRQLTRALLLIVACWLMVGVPIHFLGGDRLRALVFRTRIDCMAIGGLLSLAVLYKDQAGSWMDRCYRIIRHRATGLLGMVSFAALLAASYQWKLSLYQLYALLFGILIVRVSSRPGGWLETAPLKYLGKRSYGVYLLHHFMIYLVFKNIPSLLEIPGPWGDLAVFVLASLLTVLAAALSYRYLESPFLRTKAPPRPRG